MTGYYLTRTFIFTGPGVFLTYNKKSLHIIDQGGFLAQRAKVVLSPITAFQLNRSRANLYRLKITGKLPLVFI